MKSRWIKKGLWALTLLGMLGQSVVLAAPQETAGRLSLRVNEENLSLQVTDGQSGYTWASGRELPESEELNDLWKNQILSGVTISYYDTKTKKIKKAASVPEDCKITYSGGKAKLKFAKLGISLELELSVGGDYLSLRVPAVGITESEKNQLVSVTLLPFFGSTEEGKTPGYILIPDGCGALMEFETPPAHPDYGYSAPVYGPDYSVSAFSQEDIYTRQREQLSAPVYGMVHSDSKNAFLAWAKEGGEAASLSVYPAGVTTRYNWAAYEFFYRKSFFHQTGKDGSGYSDLEPERNTFDIEMRYYFLTGEQADYSGLAARYRALLMEDGVLSPKETPGKTLRLEFLGGEKKKSLFGFRSLTLTTTEEVKEMLADSGLDPVMVLRNFREGEAIPRRLGGNRGAQKLSGSLYFTADYTYTGKNDKKNNVKTVDERMLSYEKEFKNYTLTKFVQGIDRAAVQYERDKVTLSGAKPGVENTGTLLTADYQSKGKKSRTQAKQAVQTMFGAEKTAFYRPNDYVWRNTEAYFDMPLSASGHRYFEKEVPFLQLVLHGSMDCYGPPFNFAEDSREYLLKHIEYGVYPSFVLTKEAPNELSQTDSAWVYSSEYRLWKDTMLETDREIAAVLKQVEGAWMISHRKQNPDTAAVSYSNGKTVLVNYGDRDADVSGHLVKARGYEVIG